MANLQETSEFPEAIYRIETDDDVIGGEEGISNKQAKQLGNRTRYLKNQIDGIKLDLTSANNNITALNNGLTDVNTDLRGIHNNLTGILNDLIGVHGDLTGVHNELTGINNDVDSILGDLTGVHNELGTTFKMNEVKLIPDGDYTIQAGDAGKVICISSPDYTYILPKIEDFPRNVPITFVYRGNGQRRKSAYLNTSNGQAIREFPNDPNVNDTSYRLRLGDRLILVANFTEWLIVMAPTRGDRSVVGSYLEVAGGVQAYGYQVCNGGAVSRADFADLFEVIGTTFGAGDGFSTFNVPNKAGFQIKV